MPRQRRPAASATVSTGVSGQEKGTGARRAVGTRGVGIMKRAHAERGLIRDIGYLSLYSVASGVAGALALGALILLLSWPARAGEAPFNEPVAQSVRDEVRGPRLRLRSVDGGGGGEAPLLDTDVRMEISGMTARVVVRQRFRNPGEQWVEGVYVFPLPEAVAVDRMRLRIGGRLVEGEVREKAQALRQYQQARREGRKASLLSQQRPNIFTTAVANIGPGEEVGVEIEYQQALRYDQGRFSIRFPMVVAPRYIPGRVAGSGDLGGFGGGGWARDTDQVPDASRITPPLREPGAERANRVAMEIRLAPGFPLALLESPHHAIERLGDEGGVHRIRLRESVLANRDFVLNWAPRAGDEPPR